MSAITHDVGSGLGSAPRRFSARQFSVGLALFLGFFGFLLFLLQDTANAILAVLKAAK